MYARTKSKVVKYECDTKLPFETHLKIVCKKVSHKLHALARVSNYISQRKLRIIMKEFITSQFGYCPLEWMFHSRKSNNKINNLHEKALRLNYEDRQSTFEELLIQHKSAHHKNLQILATEMCQVQHGIASDIMNNFFRERNITYKTRNYSGLQTRNIKPVH